MDMLDIYLKSSLVFVIERPRYAARAEAATKLPPFLSSLLSSYGDSKSDLNLRIFSSEALKKAFPRLAELTLAASMYVQSVFSALSQGLEDDILENSIGLHGQ